MKAAAAAVVLSLASYSLCSPVKPPAGQSVSLVRRQPQRRTPEDWATWAADHRAAVQNKYGGDTTSSTAKRSTGTALLTNQNADSSFFGSLAIGTPATAFNVILDTGSADLWLASDKCTPASGCPATISTFSGENNSSSFTNTSNPFSITYGSGKAVGTLARETVNVAGFEVQDQTFGLVYAVTQNLLNRPVSGLLGLAFNSIASSRAQTFWQAALPNFDQPLFAFHLTRFINDSSVEREEFGGSMSLGFTNTSLYTGDIDYVDIPGGQERYWSIPVREITVNGNSVSGLPSIDSSDALAAIDTGTTLVGGPPDAIASIFSQIPGSQPAGAQYDGYYTYPCNTDVTVTMAFGSSGKAWTVSPADFRLAQIERNVCLGGFFEFESGGGSGPSWIVGDVFLKNVYSVFRATPASVGFAQLSDTAISYNGADIPVPSPTIGAVAATTRSGNSAPLLRDKAMPASALVGVLAAMIMLM